MDNTSVLSIIANIDSFNVRETSAPHISWNDFNTHGLGIVSSAATPT